MVEKKKGDTEQRMNALSLMLKEIYIPLMEQRTEIKHHMTRFNTQITTSIQQAYGQITIDVPYYDEDMSEERIHSDEALLHKLQEAVNSWTDMITKKMEAEAKRAAEHKHETATGETEFWSQRAATYNTLHQQLSMPSVRRIIQILSNVSYNDDSYNVETFRQKEKDFKKEHAVAKDFVKFLLTLERQFKNINKGDLKSIDDTLPSLLNGLKLIWTISRHIHFQHEEFQDIIEAISNEICQKVRNKINIRTIFKQSTNTAIEEIDKAINVLDKWQQEFLKTKMEIEAESTINRWEFSKIKDILAKPKHIILICKDIKDVCVAIKDFYAILNKDLKAVTGSSDEIDSTIDRVRDQVSKLQAIQSDVFNSENKAEWDTSFNTFTNQIQDIETVTISMINSTFKENLNSSTGAFDLLDKFKSIETRPKIKECLQDKYQDVLLRYANELEEMQEIYQQNHTNPLRPKNMPENSGKIAWARSIVTRIKTPIDKFKTQPQILTGTDAGKQAALRYVKLAQTLTESYENKIFETWERENSGEVLKMLKQNILKQDDKSKRRVYYYVNFDPRLKVIIREAKFLDRIGKPIPDTIINIALQEKDYARHIDKLKQLLRSYDSVLDDLKPIETNLLSRELMSLQDTMKKGVENHNWFSLSIPEYIKECSSAIEKFREVKIRVVGHALNIQKKIEKIESAEILRQISMGTPAMELQEFTDYFDQHRVKVVNELVRDYEEISNFLKQIEQVAFGTDELNRPEMFDYYKYWERKVFNALASMTIRALATNKIIWYSDKPMINQVCKYSNNEFLLTPTAEDMNTQLKKFTSNILEASANFGRWYKNTGMLVPPKQGEDANEKVFHKSYNNDMIFHPVVSHLGMAMTDLLKNIASKQEATSNRYLDQEEKKMNDKQGFQRIQKSIERNKSVKYIEHLIMFMKNKKNMIKKKSDKIKKYFILVDYTQVKQTLKTEVNKFLDDLGKILTELAKSDLLAIQKEIEAYNMQLNKEADSIEEIKLLLETIAKIRNTSMDMELKINETQEQFRVLKMYKYPVDNQDQDAVDRIAQNWGELLESADRKDQHVDKIKGAYSDMTIQQVENFKKELSIAYQEYKENGPGAEHVTLEQGLILLENSKQQCLAFANQKEEMVLSENLFGLPISQFDELIKMENENEKFTLIYEIFKENQERRAEWAVITWQRLEYDVLESGANEFDKQVRKLEKSQKDIDKLHPFIKLKAAIKGFKDSLPLIRNLTDPAVIERHWKRIMEETGKDIGEINLKTFTLSKVFELELQFHEEKVTEICKEAKEEKKNDETISKIDDRWKSYYFEVFKHMNKTTNEFKGWAIKSPDEVREKIEEDILLLQTVGSSKYARSIKQKVAQWEADLNLVSDVIDIWMQVQRKWIYLESIYSSEDIKIQLQEDAKKFMKVHQTYSKLMEATQKDSRVLYQCKEGNKLNELRGISTELDRCQKNLTAYLENKRQVLPRFYFVPDDDLLQILGTSDPKAIQPHLLKLYDNCKELTFGPGNKTITHMTSDEGEIYQFENPVKPEGNIEDWMTRVDEEMKKTLHVFCKKAVFFYAKMDRVEWIMKQIGMVALVCSQIWWTFCVEDVFRKRQDGDKHAMKNELRKETDDLNNLINLMRTDLDSKVRKCINTMIVLDVHARDIVADFVRDSVMSSKEFAWEKQLRFYWDLKKDDIEIRQCTGKFDYCYEYQGLNGRLVITPLTDRCVMTLTTALTFYLGGAPAGPAGTGKTETVKDLAKSLALRCVVTCCGDDLDFKSLGVTFSGLVQTGFWGCFDEFNRIRLEVLSVVSAQIKTIQQGLIRNKTDKFTFLGTEMTLVPTIGIFITMNPGYAGRSELPDNLKALFRPVTMVVPALQLICENMLMAEGFIQAKSLACKMTVLYKLAKDQLSKQYHYDFQLRALKSVLVMAGQLKREYSDTPEDVVLMRALRDMNMPKFVYDDRHLFMGLIQDLFPGLKAERVGNEELKELIQNDLTEKGFCHLELEKEFADQVNKVMQLYETAQTRWTVMVVGPTGAGKSTIINTLANALEKKDGEKTRKDVINPKSITLFELYGVLNPETRDWTDGLLSKIFKEANQPFTDDQKPEKRWIIYDGDVDAIWVENMNSVMDDNKILTLSNGDRIRLLKHCLMLFEVYDLQFASPATISRCGMVYVDPKNLGHQPYYFKWLKSIQDKYKDVAESIHENLKEFYGRFVNQVIDRIFDGLANEELLQPLRFITPRTPLNIVTQLCTMIDAILPDPENDPPQDQGEIEHLFLFCLVWSAGACLIDEDRKAFNDFITTLSQNVGVGSFYDVFFDVKTLQLRNWEAEVKEYKPPLDRKFSSILVPTVDTTRYAWLLQKILTNKKPKPVMFCGFSGAAKTVTVQAAFDIMASMSDTYNFLKINFSSRTTSADFQKNIEENIDKKSLKSYGPKAVGKKMIMFIDDLNMPTIDKYGTQRPNALLKFLVERRQLYQRGQDLLLRDIVDVFFVGCISPTAGGNNKVDPRLMSLYNTFNISNPSADATQHIYNSILKKSLLEFPEEVQNCIEPITMATIKLYNDCKERLPRTPTKFHYTFNLRDLSRIYEGLYLSTPDKITSKTQIVRLWRNECLRVFADRLIDQTDRGLVTDELLPALVKQYFKDTEEEVNANPILFGDFRLSDPEDVDSEDPRLYEDLGSYDLIKEKMNKILEDYNFSQKPMNLVLFNDALEHITKIHRIIRFNRGSALLVGFGGSGKQSLTRLATYLGTYDMFQITLKRGYKEDDFREELKELYRTVLKKPRTFMFTDAHVVEEGFLELINNILTIGMVPALFPEEEKDGLKMQVDEEIRKKKLPDSKEFAWEYFVNKARDKLHIVMCMSPAGDSLRLRCRNFPGLITNTTIDWFFPWPRDALMDVAKFFIKDVDLSEEYRDKVCEHLVLCHQSVQTYSKEFELKFKRKNYSTPKNYLDFISNYIKFLENRRKLLTNAVTRLEGGLTTLAKAQEDTKVLGDELQIQSAEIAEKREKVEIIIQDVNFNSEVAGKEQKIASELQVQISEQNVIITREKEQADVALQAAEPALAAAQAALKKLKSDDLTELKAYNQVSAPVEICCGIAYIFFDKAALSGHAWNDTKTKFLGTPSLLDALKNKNPETITSQQAKLAKEKIKSLEKELKCSGKQLLDLIYTKSKAAGGLFEWVLSTNDCYDIFKDVEPMRDNLKKLQKKAQDSQERLDATQAKLESLNEKLRALNIVKEEKSSELNILQTKADEMTRKLNAAAKLITGLGSEQKRWTSDMENFKEDKIKLVGDCLTASAFLSYCGPFNFILRKRMLFDHWKTNLIELALPNKENFKLESFLSDDVEISKWASQGLPSDELSVQNGILTKMASRWPLCIDPQMQAIYWIKTKETQTKKNNFITLTFTQGDYIKKLEMAIKFGQSVLFESIDTEIDPMIDPVLEKNIQIRAGVPMLKLGDNELEYDENFCLCLTTKIANPNYTPEIFGKTMIINFNVTLQGLREQLLNAVVAYEKPDLEAERKQLVIDTSNNKQILKELEDQLLDELSKETDIPLVDNDPLIAVLDDAKTKSVMISEALENAKITNENIDQQRENYKSCAKRGAILFFAMSGLSAISSMYEYSLSAFLVVFNNALKQAKQDNVLTQRLKFIRDKLTYLVYEFVCMGIFEKHKLMFSFQMTTMIMEGDQELNKEELDFFLKGNTSLDSVEAKPFKWMNQNGWKDAKRLQELGGVWKTLLDDIRENEKTWKKWQDLEAPEMEPNMPCGYSTKLTKFQELLVIRIFRQDRVINAIKNFIMIYMNEQYVKSPPRDYDKIYKQSTEKTPIVLILSPGADPQRDVEQLIENLDAMNPQAQKKQLKTIALGQGMGDEAKKLIETGAIRGHWVMLHNCHLLERWLKDVLEGTIEQVTQKPDKNFRLWLTTDPTDSFPLGILQKSIKVVNEPPDGLQSNMFQFYTKLDDRRMSECPKNEFKSLIYVLSFFHSTIQERKKYGKIGWNVNYAFNQSDFDISFELIQLYLQKAHETKDEQLPWETLRYLIGEAMYGGRVTDDWDRRVLMTYLDEYMGEFIFDKNQEFFFSRSEYDYKIPIDAENMEQTQLHIAEIPLFTVPGVFGLHSNAEIQYYNNSAKSLWLWTLEMQTSEGGDGGGLNREDYILKVQADIAEKIPIVYDLPAIKKNFDEALLTPTQVVLLQEIERFNILLEGIHASLIDLRRALNGEIGMSADLEEMANQIFNGFVPTKWTTLAPKTMKNLVNWIEHFERRDRQYKDWYQVEEPRVIWLSGLHIPESYLTALVQTTCRAKNWPLDKSTLYTEVTKERNPSNIKNRLAYGTYIQGLYLEGARWNIDKNSLDYQQPKELIVEMPLIQIIPIEANRLKLRGTIKTPVYVTQMRKDSMGTGLVFEADLRTECHPSHWVLQGVALVLNTD